MSNFPVQDGDFIIGDFGDEIGECMIIYTNNGIAFADADEFINCFQVLGYSLHSMDKELGL